MMLPLSSFKILLGSESPRRREILQRMGLCFEVVKLFCNEEFPSHLTDGSIACYLAEKKSLSFNRPLNHNELLITADTIVWCENQFLGKPLDHSDALRILKKLNGRMHTVYTGVCLRTPHSQRVFVEKTNVYFKKLDNDELEYYIANYRPYDKAGAYGVQEWIGAVAIEKMEGCFYNVMGLPASRLYEELKKISVSNF